MEDKNFPLIFKVMKWQFVLNLKVHVDVIKQLNV
jgi:hypothetical protein